MTADGESFDREWRARFDRFGRSYTEEHAVSGWSRAGLAQRVALFDRLLPELRLPERARVLEVGCGAGTYVRRLAGLGYRVVAVDYSWSTLERAVSADPGRMGRYVAAEGRRLPFRPGGFDLVLCIGVLQAVSEPTRVLDEIVRVVRPGGLLLVEALNAVAPSALARRAREVCAGRPPRVRFLAPTRLASWVRARGARVVRRAGVYLPPRRLPRLGYLLGHAAVIGLLETTPGAALVAAHAFWIVAEREGRC